MLKVIKNHKSPFKLRRQRARKQRIWGKKAAAKADSPKSPASEVNLAVRQEQEPTAILQEHEPAAVLQEPEPVCVTSTKVICYLDNTAIRCNRI